MTLGIDCNDDENKFNKPMKWKSEQNYRTRLRPPKILVGLSINVPIVGSPDLLGMLLVLLWAGLRTGAGTGGAETGGGEGNFCRIVTLAAVDDEETEEATDRAKTSSSTSTASSSTFFIKTSPSSVATSSSSPSGNGRCSARKVSLFLMETPRRFHSLSTTSRLLVSSHWSWYCHVFLRGVLPVGLSSLVPDSIKDSVA